MQFSKLSIFYANSHTFPVPAPAPVPAPLLPYSLPEFAPRCRQSRRQAAEWEEKKWRKIVGKKRVKTRKRNVLHSLGRSHNQNTFSISLYVRVYINLIYKYLANILSILAFSVILQLKHGVFIFPIVKWLSSLYCSVKCLIAPRGKKNTTYGIYSVGTFTCLHIIVINTPTLMANERNESPACE